MFCMEICLFVFFVVMTTALLNVLFVFINSLNTFN